MSKGFVLLVNETIHGGEVISASSNTIVNDKPVALGGEGSCFKYGCQMIASVTDCVAG
ncbi:hypothetical protein QLG10_29015 [Pseudomonas sp. V98_8]|jgi:uncharacterized Zn-binding protein involved in type VI secretion|uniref:hypothetical protein n=1 Tax=Pseudomonas sp. V98_8 TaxID=3044228 RepID=UPI00249E5E0D|nr:hypothetical protein [Pseudomonas sp. V98_8]MDI3396477.1 hypothetical protein [Pseudomonas sp. V98_8]